MKALSYRSASLLSTSLLLTGAGALSPTSVLAAGADKCSFGTNTSLPMCSTFVFDGQGDKMLKLVKLPTVGSGTITFNQPDPAIGVWVVNVDFINDLIPGAPGLPGAFEYDLTIDPAPANIYYFDDGALDIIGPSVGPTPAFTASMTATGLVPSPLSVTQTNRSALGSFKGLLKTTRVVNDYNVTAGSTNAILNSFSQKESFIPPETEVPGPLPLLGAGAAFGFSRRLRSRVLAARRA